MFNTDTFKMSISLTEHNKVPRIIAALCPIAFEWFPIIRRETSPGGCRPPVTQKRNTGNVRYVKRAVNSNGENEFTGIKIKNKLLNYRK